MLFGEIGDPILNSGGTRPGPPKGLASTWRSPWPAALLINADFSNRCHAGLERCQHAYLLIASIDSRDYCLSSLNSCAIINALRPWDRLVTKSLWWRKLSLRCCGKHEKNGHAANLSQLSKLRVVLGLLLHPERREPRDVQDFALQPVSAKTKP
jgi:hypothetical protein